MTLRVLLILCVLVYASHSMAEYRVYQYIVKSRHPFVNDSDSYTVTSTLDPVSYIAYHGGQESLQVDLLTTWMCKGNTAGRAPCSSPLANEKQIGESQASEAEAE